MISSKPLKKEKEKEKKITYSGSWHILLNFFIVWRNAIYIYVYVIERGIDRWMDIHAHTYKSWSLIILFHMFEESFYTRWVEISYWTLYCALGIFVKGVHFVQGIKVGLNCWE